MTKIDLTEMRKLRDRAYFKIVASKKTESLWSNAKTREDRELLMTWAIVEITKANKS
jgi:hypothetical protein